MDCANKVNFKCVHCRDVFSVNKFDFMIYSQKTDHAKSIFLNSFLLHLDSAKLLIHIITSMWKFLHLSVRI